MSVLISNLNTIESVKLDIKSAIEAKGVSMSGVSFPDYPSAIASISGGGGIDEKDYTEGNVVIVNLSNSASFVGVGVFSNNSVLQTVNLPVCEYVNDYAFYGCTSLSQVNLPACTSVGRSAFSGCTSLSQVNLLSCSTIRSWAFYSCKSLTTIDLPVCTYIGSSAFSGCTSLSQVNIPSCERIENQAFNKCYPLSQVNLPVCSYIGNEAFRNCTSLSQVYLGSNSICILSNSNAFMNTPIASGTGSIYVLSSLVSDYQAATNWSYFSSQIFAIPE